MLGVPSKEQADSWVKVNCHNYYHIQLLPTLLQPPDLLLHFGPACTSTTYYQVGVLAVLKMDHH